MSTLTPNALGSAGSVLIVVIAFFLGNNGLLFAALSFTILAAAMAVIIGYTLAIRCLAYRMATQLQNIGRIYHE